MVNMDQINAYLGKGWHSGRIKFLTAFWVNRNTNTAWEKRDEDYFPGVDYENSKV